MTRSFVTEFDLKSVQKHLYLKDMKDIKDDLDVLARCFSLSRSEAMRVLKSGGFSQAKTDDWFFIKKGKRHTVLLWR